MKVTENPEQGARLEKIVEALHLTQISFAQSLGYSQGYVSQLFSGKRNISRGILQNIAKIFPEVDIHWLVTGDGDIFLAKKSGPQPGVLNGVMEPEGEYGGRGEGRGEGRLEWQERKIQELLAENERLRERLGDVEREQLEMNRRLAELEGKGE